MPVFDIDDPPPDSADKKPESGSEYHNRGQKTRQRPKVRPARPHQFQIDQGPKKDKKEQAEDG